MLKISKQSDYGLLLLSYLKGKKDYSPLSELTDKIHLPKRFLAKIAYFLKANGFLESFEGKTGGYKLTKNFHKKTLYDYLKIFEPSLNIASCEKTNYQCPWEDYCQHSNFLKNKLKKIFVKELKNYKLIDVI